jgi:hypothetical protein
VASYTPNDFAQPNTEQNTYAHRVYLAPWLLSNNTGPIPFCARYSPSGSVAFLYIQTDRVLLTSGSMTVAGNYIINGTSAPTVTSVSFISGKSYIRLTLSSTLAIENSYTVKVADNTFYDGYFTNIASSIPIYVDLASTQSGVTETVDIGTPVVT